MIPAGTTGVAVHTYPLRPSTRYWLARAGFFGSRDAITVGDLLQAPRVGRIKVIELMCVAELARSHSEAIRTDLHAESSDASDVGTTPEDSLQSHWGPFKEAAIPLLSAAHEFCNADTVADALREDLSRLAGILGVSKDLDAIPIRGLVHDPGIAETVIARLDAVVVSMSPSLTYVIDHRLLSDEPETLDAIGQERHLSRQRVRQLQVNAQRRIRQAVGREIDIMGRMIADSCPPIMEAQRFHDTLARFFPSSMPVPLSTRLARWSLARKLDYSCCDGMCLNAEARNVVAALQSRSQSLADETGLIQEASLRALLPDPSWEPFLGLLSRHAGLHRVGSFLARRATLTARVSAAILEIGRPATAKEIAVTAGISLKQAKAQLSRVPGVARADKKRWGLATWIENAYESIRVAMVERIRSNGGRVHLTSLLEELPERFGVSESSVRSYSRTPFFAVDDGYVSIANEPLRSLRQLEDVISGRTGDGRPYWTFVVEDGHLAGHSISRVPPELALEIGCQPDGRAAVAVDSPPGASTASVNWRLTSTYGATVGRVREALRLAGAKPGDRVSLVVNAPHHIEFRLTPPG